VLAATLWDLVQQETVEDTRVGTYRPSGLATVTALDSAAEIERDGNGLEHLQE